MEFEEKKSGDILKFYVTVGRGLSGLVAGMLKTSEFQVDQITEGKIFFWCPRRPEPSEEALLQLKGVERIFLQLGFWLFETEPQPDEIVSFLDGLACKVPLVYEDWKYRQNPQSSDEIPAKRRKVLGSTTFRVNVKLAGTVGRRLNFSVVSKRFAHQLITEGNSDWTVDLHSPVVEISIHINDRSCIVGIPLTKSPLSNRKYLKQPGLRSTICDVMISLADVSNTNEGLVVLDPMCGAGTLLVEAMVQQRNDWHIGFDCRWKLQSTPAIDVLKSNVNFSVTALELSQENLQFACDIPSETQVRWDLLIADATVMPLRNSSVDRILSDIPFGKKHKSAQPIELLFVKLLSEIKRVLRPAGSAVLLCPLLVKKLAQSQLAEINKSDDMLSLVSLNPVSLGVTEALILVLKKEICCGRECHKPD